MSECLGLFVQRLKSCLLKPERRWTLVNRRFVRDLPPVPTVRVGGSSSSDQVQEHMKRTQIIVGRNVSIFTESRGQKRLGEDVEEQAAKAEEQHLDADVEVLAHETWRVEDVAGDAADAAPEQMNSLVQSKTEVFERI